MYSHREDGSEWIVRRAAVGFALWSASVRLFGLKGSINLIMCVTYVLIGRQGTWALAYKRVVAAVLCCRVVEFPPVSQWSMLRPGFIVGPACGIFGGVTPLRASDFVVAPLPPLGVRSVITLPLRHYYVSSGTQRGRGSSIVVRGCGGACRVRMPLCTHLQRGRTSRCNASLRKSMRLGACV